MLLRGNPDRFSLFVLLRIECFARNSPLAVSHKLCNRRKVGAMSRQFPKLSVQKKSLAHLVRLFGAVRLPSWRGHHLDSPNSAPNLTSAFMPEKYAALLALLEQRSGAQVDFRLAETPLFMHVEQLEEMASAGAELAEAIIGNPDCLAAARRAIPAGYLVAGETPHPNFLTADFALVRDTAADLVPSLVEIQAFPFRQNDHRRPRSAPTFCSSSACGLYPLSRPRTGSHGLRSASCIYGRMAAALRRS